MEEKYKIHARSKKSQEQKESPSFNHDMERIDKNFEA